MIAVFDQRDSDDSNDMKLYLCPIFPELFVIEISDPQQYVLILAHAQIYKNDRITSNKILYTLKEPLCLSIIQHEHKVFICNHYKRYLLWLASLSRHKQTNGRTYHLSKILLNHQLDRDSSMDLYTKAIITSMINNLDEYVTQTFNSLLISGMRIGLLFDIAKHNFRLFQSVMANIKFQCKIQRIVTHRLNEYKMKIRLIIRRSFVDIDNDPQFDYIDICNLMLDFFLWKHDEMIINTIPKPSDAWYWGQPINGKSMLILLSPFLRRVDNGDVVVINI